MALDMLHKASIPTTWKVKGSMVPPIIDHMIIK